MNIYRYAAATLLLAGSSWAATWTGSLIDVMCKPENIAAGIKKCTKTRACMLSERCSASGYGIVMADGTFLKFDAAASAKALATLKTMSKDTDIKATVTGTLEGDVIQVTNLEIQ